MTPYRHCPVHGSALDDPDAEGGAYCPACGRSWYRNMAPTAGAAIVKDGKALITVRAREPEKGKLDVPGGFLGPFEDPIEGLKREVREELGIEIETAVEDCISMVPHLYGDGGEAVLSLGFKVRWVSGEPSPADDVAEIRWLTEDELEVADFAWPHDRELLRRALKDG
jgi:ADP-ribose pyrophosphatase YjhB (NUDIX family)